MLSTLDILFCYSETWRLTPCIAIPGKGEALAGDFVTSSRRLEISIQKRKEGIALNLSLVNKASFGELNYIQIDYPWTLSLK